MAWFTPEACGHGRRFSGLQRIKERRGGAQEPGPTESHPFKSNLCTHTLTHCCTCARARTHPLHPPTKLVLWSLSQLGPIKDSQDESITSSTRARASSLPLIILSCQVKQLSAAAPLLDAVSPLQSQSVASVPGRGCPLTAEIAPLSHFIWFHFWKCINRFVLVRVMLHVDITLLFVCLGCAAQITQH